MLNLMLLSAVLDTAKVATKVVSNNMSYDPSMPTWMIIMNVMLGLLAAGGILNWVIKSFISMKKAKEEAKLKDHQEKIQHGNKLEVDQFNFNKEKYEGIQLENQQFQKEIINTIFDKFVKQTEWITALHDKSIEKTITLMSSIEEQNRSINTQMDVMNNRVRSVEDKLIKNTNSIITKLDMLIKILVLQDIKINKNTNIDNEN